MQLVRLVDDGLALACREVGIRVNVTARLPTDYGDNWGETDFRSYLYVSSDVLERLRAEPQRALIEHDSLLPLYRAAWADIVETHARFLVLMLGRNSDPLDEVGCVKNPGQILGC